LQVIEEFTYEDLPDDEKDFTDIESDYESDNEIINDKLEDNNVEKTNAGPQNIATVENSEETIGVEVAENDANVTQNKSNCRKNRSKSKKKRY
jgi:hypothetical protein